MIVNVYYNNNNNNRVIYVLVGHMNDVYTLKCNDINKFRSFVHGFGAF